MFDVAGGMCKHLDDDIPPFMVDNDLIFQDFFMAL